MGGSTANGAELIYPTPEDNPADGTAALPTNLSVEQVPFQPWARALFEYRQSTFLKDEPHVRCKPSGVARLFHTPYGLEIFDLRTRERSSSPASVARTAGAWCRWTRSFIPRISSRHATVTRSAAGRVTLS